MNYTRDKKILLTVYFFFYYAVFASFFIDHRLLSQYQPIFFNYNRDLSELWLIATGLPRYMIAHPWTFPVADGLLCILPLPLILYFSKKGRFSTFLGVFFCLFLGFYLLLADIFWQCHLEPFILYGLLSLAFLTNRPPRFYTVLAATRYYFLYLFFSAAIWKIARGAVFNIEEMSNILLFHHTELLTGNGASTANGAIPANGASFAGRCFTYLVDHPRLSYGLYLGSVLLEASFIIGFFTRRWDRALLALVILFVLADLLLMRIPYWTILLGGVTFWLPAARTRPKEKKIVIYETTHHENLPALLDLSEASFNKVTVFLKESSYQGLAGEKGRPAPDRHSSNLAERWPKTDFIRQPEDETNRKFIARVFSFLKTNDYSHFHLATLDNNLLLFSIRLFWITQVSRRRTDSGRPSLHVSLTVHEIGEYFSYRFNNLRAITESIAKLGLHHQIRHYHCFLPAMAESFRQRLPGATAVFIPSRFYSAASFPAPPAPAGPTNPTPPSPTTPAAGSPFTIVIPGTVDPNRRDYAAVVDFLTRYLHRTNTSAPAPSGAASPATASPLELILLGNSDSTYGTGIVNKLQQLQSPTFTLRSYRGTIPQTEYEQQLSKAHLLWSPLKVQKVSIRNNPETYGLTTASGLTADLLLNATPALVPADFTIPEPFRAAMLPYRSPEEIQQIIVQLMQDIEYRQGLRNRIHASFTFFTKETFAPAFSTLTGLDKEGKER